MREHTSVYRLIGHDGALLYVGVAGNPGRRFEQHRSDKPWWGDVGRITLEHYPDRRSAMDIEREAIITEKPMHNIVHARTARRVQTTAASTLVDTRRSQETISQSPLIPDPTWSYASRQSGFTRRENIWLYAEPNWSSCIDDCFSDDGEEQLDYYVDSIRHHDQASWANDAVSISWFVDTDCGMFEAAPFALAPGDEDTTGFLAYFTWPVDDDGERLDWFRLPVRMDRFPHFTKALGWSPSPFQASCPLRSIIESRSGYVPGSHR